MGKLWLRRACLIGLVALQTTVSAQSRKEEFDLIPGLERTLSEYSSESWTIQAELRRRVKNRLPEVPLRPDPPLSAAAQAYWDMWIGDDANDTIRIDEHHFPLVIGRVNSHTDEAAQEFYNHPQVKKMIEEGKEYTDRRQQKRLDFYRTLESRFDISLMPHEYVERSFQALLKSKSLGSRNYTDAEAQRLARSEIEQVYGSDPRLWDNPEVRDAHSRKVQRYLLMENPARALGVSPAEFERWKKTIAEWIFKNDERKKLFMWAIEVDFAKRPIYIAKFDAKDRFIEAVLATPTDLLNLEHNLTMTKHGYLNYADIYRLRKDPSDPHFYRVIEPPLPTIDGKKVASPPRLSIYEQKWSLSPLEKKMIDFDVTLKGGSASDEIFPFLDLHEYLGSQFKYHHGAVTDLYTEVLRLKHQKDPHRLLKEVRSKMRSIVNEHSGLTYYQSSTGEEVLVPFQTHYSGPAFSHEYIRYWGLRRNPGYWQLRATRLRHYGKTIESLRKGSSEIKSPASRAGLPQEALPDLQRPYFGAKSQATNAKNLTPHAQFKVAGDDLKQNEFFLLGDFSSKDFKEAQPRLKTSILRRREIIMIRGLASSDTYQEMIPIPTPADADLETLVLHSDGGKLLKLGVDYTVVRSKGDGSYMILAKNHRDAILIHEASFSRVLRKDAKENQPRKLRKIKTTHLRAVLNEMRLGGLTAVADTVEALVADKKHVDIKLIEDALLDMSLYSHIVEKPTSTGSGRFAKFSKFLDDSGRLCLQCDGAQALFAEIVNAYAETASDPSLRAKFEGGLVFRDGALWMPGHARSTIWRNNKLIYRTDTTPTKLDPRNSSAEVKNEAQTEVPAEQEVKVPVEEMSSDVRNYEVRKINVERSRRIHTSLAHSKTQLLKTLSRNKNFKNRKFEASEPLAKMLKVAGILDDLLNDRINFTKAEATLRPVLPFDSPMPYVDEKTLFSAISHWSQKQKSLLDQFIKAELRKKKSSSPYRVYIDPEAQEQMQGLLSAIIDVQSIEPRQAAPCRPSALQDTFEEIRAAM